MEIDGILSAFAGLGLFFVGLSIFGENLKSFGKPYVRPIVESCASSDWRAMAGGIAAGAVTNSGKTVTFALTALVSSGLLDARRALPIIVGGSLGSALLVLWVSFNIDLIDLFMLGVAGLLYQFGNSKSSRSKFLAGTLLGLGLIFYGLALLKNGASELKDSPAFVSFLANTHGYWILSLLLGAIGAFVTQSGSTISIVAMSFVGAGLLNFDETIMFVYGTNIGSGVSTALLGLTVYGAACQLVMFHAAVKIVGAFLLVPLLYLETYGGVPTVKALAALFTNDTSSQLGTIYIIYEVASALMLAVALSPAARALEKLWPKSKEDILARIHFVHHATGHDVLRSVELIEKEQFRLIRRSPRYFDTVRKNLQEHHRIPASVLRDSNKTVQDEIRHKITNLMKQKLPEPTAAEVLRRHAMHKWITDLDNHLFQLAELFGKASPSDKTDKIRQSLLVGLDAILAVARSALTSPTPDTGTLLLEMTTSRTTLLRWFGVSEQPGLDLNFKEKKWLFETVVAYESLIWVIHQLGSGLERNGAVSSNEMPSPRQNVSSNANVEPRQMRKVTHGTTPSRKIVESATGLASTPPLDLRQTSSKSNNLNYP